MSPPETTPRRAVVAAIALAVVVLAAALPAPANAAQIMRYACAGPAGTAKGLLHFVRSPRGCRGRGEIAVAFPSDAPVHVCLSRARGRVRLVRLVDDPARCKRSGPRGELVRSLPRSESTHFCASGRARLLRWVAKTARCGPRQFLVALARRIRPLHSTVFDDVVSTSEDQQARIAIHGRPQSPVLGRTVHLESLDPAGTVGDVHAGGGAVVYDPLGRFDRLKLGESASDSFAYRATDGVHRTHTRVLMRLTGENDPPVANPDSATADEGATSPVNIDVIHAAALPGTLGKDSDPEGDPLSLATADSSSQQGGVVTQRGDGTLDYDPAGRFEALGAGQVGTDTFHYSVADTHGAVSSDAPVSVAIAGENDRPVLGGIETSAAGIVGGPIVAPATNRVTDRLTVSDVDRNPGAGGTEMGGAIVRIVSGFDPAHHDALEYTAANGISGEYDATTGSLRLHGAAPPAAYQDALRSVAFTTDENTPPSDRTISFQVDDGGLRDSLSNVLTRDVHVASATPAISVQPELTPSFSPGVSDYAVRCSGDPLSMAVDASPGTYVSVDGGTPRSGAFASSVNLSGGQGFQFVVARGTRSDTYHVRCLPSDFPPYDATVDGTPQAQWYLVTPSSNYAVVFDAHGVPVWWRPAETPPFDFKLLSNGHLGFFSTLNGSAGRLFQEYSLDGTLVRATDTVGTSADFHDYAELPNGNRYMLSYRLRDHVDVSAYTGSAQDMDAAVVDAEIQELAPDGSLVWSWNSKDHIGLDETGRWWNPAMGTIVRQTSDGRNVWDIVHMNSIEPDGDGLIVSTRHTDAVYRIDRATGDITWKLGGTHRPQSLEIVGDDANAATDFGGQHDPRRQPDGTLTLHDNGTGTGRAPRALRFRVDTTARTATLVESVTDPLATASGCCGSARKLPGGNWVMSWGLTNLVTELTPSGARPFKLTFAPGVLSYRAAPVPPGVLSASALRTGMDVQYPRP
jgi:VCBS repeat-containing protein